MVKNSLPLFLTDVGGGVAPRPHNTGRAAPHIKGLSGHPIQQGIQGRRVA